MPILNYAKSPTLYAWFKGFPVKNVVWLGLVWFEHELTIFNMRILNTLHFQAVHKATGVPSILFWPYLWLTLWPYTIILIVGRISWPIITSMSLASWKSARPRPGPIVSPPLLSASCRPTEICNRRCPSICRHCPNSCKLNGSCSNSYDEGRYTGCPGRMCRYLPMYLILLPT